MRSGGHSQSLHSRAIELLPTSRISTTGETAKWPLKNREITEAGICALEKCEMRDYGNLV